MKNEYLTNEEWNELTEQLCVMIAERTDKDADWCKTHFSQLQEVRDDLVDLIHSIRGLLVDAKEAQ
jgi:hypothetical protein